MFDADVYLYICIHRYLTWIHTTPTVCDMTDSCAQHDSFTLATWFTNDVDVYHSWRVWHDLFTCATWLSCVRATRHIHTCNTTYKCSAAVFLRSRIDLVVNHPNCVWYDSSTCATWIIYVCHETHFDMWHTREFSAAIFLRSVFDMDGYHSNCPLSTLRLCGCCWAGVHIYIYI